MALAKLATMIAHVLSVKITAWKRSRRVVANATILWRYGAILVGAQTSSTPSYASDAILKHVTVFSPQGKKKRQWYNEHTKSHCLLMATNQRYNPV